MKHILFSFLLIASMSLSAQMGPCMIKGEIGARDMFYKIDELPDNYDLGAKGDNNRWSFSMLRSPRSYIYKYDTADQGRYHSFFEDADMVIREPWGKEEFFVKKGGIWYSLGYVEIKDNSIEPSVIIYDDPIGACPPHGFGEYATSQSTYTIDTTVTEITVSETKDASGTMYLPDGAYDVDRIEHITTIASANGEQSIRKFIFVDQLTGEHLLDAELDPYGALSKVMYKTLDETVSKGELNSPNSFLLYPNKTFGQIRLDFKNFNPGRYDFIVKDIVGKRIWSNSYQINKNQTIKEDLSFLPRGVYTYVIKNVDQISIVTRRLAIIKS